MRSLLVIVNGVTRSIMARSVSVASAGSRRPMEEVRMTVRPILLNTPEAARSQKDSAFLLTRGTLARSLIGQLLMHRALQDWRWFDDVAICRCEIVGVDQRHHGEV